MPGVNLGNIPAPFKVCRECGIRKPRSGFSERRVICKACRAKKRYWKNPEKFRRLQKEFRDAHPGWRREQQLKHKYGLSVDQYNEILANQNSMCAICGCYATTLAVDHDHVTNRIRGLICGNCNTGLGMFKDSVTSLAKAIEYLSKGE
jgi:hypothetical protein